MNAPAPTPIGGTFRRGLVLQGGGAKGAFQFGVLQELHENGIQFDVITGTSVGALNGAIVAAGAWELGGRLWSELTLGRAFRWSGWAAIYTALSLPGVLYLGWLTTAYDSLLPVGLRRLFQFLASAPFITLFLASNFIDGWPKRIVWGACTLALSAAAYFVAGKQNYGSRLQLTVPYVIFWVVGVVIAIHEKLMSFRVLEVSALVLLVSLALLLLLMGFIHQRITVPYVIFWVVGVVIAIHEKLMSFRTLEVSALVLLVSLAPLLLLMGFIHQRTNAALFSNSPLRQTVEAIVRAGIRQPLLATAAAIVPEYFDPDDYEYTRVKNAYVALPRSGFLPVYGRIDKLDSAEAVDALLASAALPLGIVPNSRSRAKRMRFVDGWVTDNTPWFPLIDSLPCEEIVVVLCEPESDAKDEAKVTRDMWRTRDRAIRVMTELHGVPNPQMNTPWYRTPPITKKQDPPVVVPLRNPQFWPESKTINVVIISPPESLGNVLSGNMNFSRIRALENVKLGRKAAEVELKKGSLTQSSR